MTKTYAEALQGASLLLKTAGIDADSAAYVLSARQQWSRSQLILHGRDVLPAALETQFTADVQRLLANEPAQYIVGTAPFWGRDFKVTPAVLIPRFDTEVLVDWILSDYAVGSATGLDVGTGSGIIAVTVASEAPNVTMRASDISSAALAVATENAARLSAPVDFQLSNLLADVDGKFDFIVSNLPYIDHDEESVMDASTLAFEPHLALFAADHGLALFRELFAQLPDHLRAGGRVYFEFGYRQQPALARMISLMLPTATAEFRQDEAGNPRAVRITFA